MLYLGIDLGTTFSLASYINAADQVALVPDQFDANNFRTPSIIHISANGCFVGDPVESQLLENPSSNHVRFIKLAMGESETFQDHQQREWRPESLSALILKKLLNDASSFLPQDIGGAVILVVIKLFLFLILVVAHSTHHFFNHQKTVYSFLPQTANMTWVAKPLTRQ